jgi:hypothetical protein
MRILSKLFGKEAPTPEPFDLEPTAEMTDEDKYWQLIADSIDESGGDLECQENVLIGLLEKLSPKEMVGFRLRTDKLLYDTYNSEMWCAGYIMNGGCSDDMFEYFRLWVISRGRETYEKAKADPDSLVTEDDQMGQGYDFESLWYVALKAFENKTGKELYDYIDYENFKFGEGNYPQFDFTWSEDDPESMKKICPKLFERFAD